MAANLPSPWELAAPPSGTSVSVDQLQAQGGKYTPDQMAAFDRGRGEVLAMEQGSGTPPDPREIQGLNPIQQASFQSFDPTQMAQGGPSQSDGPVPPWMLPQEKTVGDKISQGLSKGFDQFIDSAKNTLQHPLATMAGNAAAASDLITMPVNMAHGVAAYLGTLASGKSMSEASEAFSKQQQSESMGSNLTDPKAKEQYEQGMALVNWAMQKMHEGGESITDKMLKSDIPFIREHAALGGALTEAISNVLAGEIGVKGGAKLFRGKGGVETPPPTPDTSQATVGSTQTLAEKMGLAGPIPKPGEQPAMFTVKGKPVEAGAEQPLGVDASPEQMSQEFDQRQGGFNFNPLDQGESGDMFGPNQRVAAPDMTPDVDAAIRTGGTRQSELDLTPQKPAAVAQDYIDSFEKGQGLKPTEAGTPPIPNVIRNPREELFGDINLNRVKTEQENSAWEKYKQRVAENQKAQAALDSKYSDPNFQPEQSSPSVEPISPLAAKKLGGTGRKGFGQGGAVNFGRGEDLAKRLQQLKESLSFVDRNPESMKVGDTVRMMNGKVGTITNISQDGRYSIEGKDFKDSVPRQGIDYKYKPQGNAAETYKKMGSANPNAGKFGQGGAVNLRNIFRAKDPTLKPEEKQGPGIPLSDDALIDLLHKQWARASSVEDFRDGLLMEQKMNPAIPNDVIQDAATFYNHFDKGWRPEKSVYGSMSKLNQRESADTRPFTQMMKELVLGKKTVKDPVTGELSNRDYTLSEGKLKGSDDLNLVKKEIFDPLHIISTSFEKPAGRVYNNVYSTLADIHRQWSVKLADLMNHNKPWLNLSRKSKSNVLDADAYWDSNVNRQILLDQQIDWPTKEMLMDKKYTGLSSAEADAYLERTKGLDKGYAAANIEKPKLPGYMHRSWSGYWRVNMVHPEAGLVEVRKTLTRSGAKQWVKAAEKRGLRAEIVEPSLSTKHTFVADTERMIQAASNMGKLGKIFAKSLIEMQNDVLQGTIAESLERRGISGYIGEGGTRPESFLHPLEYIKNRHYNNKMGGLYEQSMNDFARAGKNRAIIEQVARPFFQNIDKFRKTPNLTDAVKDLVSTATGFSAQENIGVDRMIKSGFIKMGLPPSLPREAIKALNTFVRTERINSANLGFAAEHFAFALPGIWDLNRMHIERGVTGEKQGSFWKALLAAGQDTVTFGTLKSAEGKRAAKWAEANGVYSSNYYDHPEFKGLGGKVWNLATHKLLEVFINRAKSVSFQMAYRYFKDIMPDSQALSAAANHVKKTMQSFDALDTPEIFKEGYGGRSIRPFNQIHFYNLARTLEQTSAYLRNLKDNPIAAQKLLIPLTGLAATYMALGGAKGVAFHNDWELIRKYLMEQNPDLNLHSYEEYMMNMGLPDWATFGLVPHLTGADIRGTFTTNLNLEDLVSGAGFEALGKGVGLGFQELRKQLTGEANEDKIYANTRGLLPTTAVPWYEDEKAKLLNGNIPHATRLDPMSPRTPEEDLFYKIASKRPISESIRDEKVAIQKEHEAQDQKWREYRLRQIVNKTIGFGEGGKDVGDLIAETVEANRGYNVKQISQDIKEAIPKRMLPEAIQQLQKAAAANKSRQADMINTIITTLQGGGSGR